MATQQFSQVITRANTNYIGPGAKFDPINQILKVRGIDGQEIAIVDWSHQQVYSTIDTLTGWTDSELYAFTYTRSNKVSSSNTIPPSSRRTATLRETNVVQAGQMGGSEELLVYGIAVKMFMHVADEDDNVNYDSQPNHGGPIPFAGIIETCNDRLVLELEISDKAFYQASIGWFNSGFGAFSSASPAGTLLNVDNSSFANTGLPSHEARWLSQIPCHVGSTEKYRVIVHNPSGAPVNYLDEENNVTDLGISVSYLIILDALHKRPTA